MNKKPYIYMIAEDTYEDTVHERILLYSFVRQLAHLTKKAETMEDFFHLKEAAAIYGAQAEGLFESWDISRRYLVNGTPGDLDNIKGMELVDYDDCDTGCPETNHAEGETEDDEEGFSFFDVMAELIAESKTVTADMEAALAELDSASQPFRHNEEHD